MEHQTLNLFGHTGTQQGYQASHGWTSEMRDPSAVLNDCRAEVEELFNRKLRVKDIVQTIKVRHGINISYTA